MRRKFFFVLFVLTLSAVAGCIQLPEPPHKTGLTRLEEKGWKIFQQESCFSSCHVQTIAAPRSGHSPAGFVPDIRARPKRSPDWYRAYLINPRAILPWTSMPSYGYLSTDEIESLVAFLLSLHRDSGVEAPQPVVPENIPQVSRDFAAYEAGRAVYLTYCAGCHGEFGNGGGVVGHVLNPEPRDFTDVLWMTKQTDAYLFAVATNGKEHTAMPPFRDVLSPRERALVIRYIQYFADAVARERMELRFVLK